MSLFAIVLWSFLLLAGSVLVHSWYSLFRNYLIARKIGVPIRVIPISHLNHFWMLVDRKVLRYVKRIFGESTFTRYNWMGWELPDRYYSHHELGNVFMLVTPGRNWLYIGHPDIVMEIVRRRDDFPRCVELTQVLDVFGPNVGSVEGQRWVTQRKLMASCFNEQYNETVWSESISQACDMMEYWTSRPSIRNTADDLRTLSLGVLSKAGFAKSFKFEGHENATHANPSESYKDSLQLILENCILIIAMGPKFFTNTSWLPKKYRELGKAITAFQNFMKDMYELEKSKVAKGLSGTGDSRTFLSSLAKASLEAKDGQYLTEQEIYGNIFVINFAGHDTSSHVFTFAVFFLAANPDIQDWVAEELHHVLGQRKPNEWDYLSDFPRLKRCLAVLYETIRLYTPVAVTKWTQDKTQVLDIGEKQIVLPPETMMCLAYSSLQSDPRWWGEDSLVWRPSRFIKAAEAGPDSREGHLDKEEFVQPRRGSFVGWSEGARDCPGRKFSQVEFVATMASLFRDWRVDPVAFEGETIEAARERVLHLIKTDSAMVLLLQMLHPEKAPLAWRRR
ncbi:putative cytochrome P450 [Stachybotrys elegans]|uniref:Cytochrome P450 n=1 Tax=Stachybotrys elegans TaxID=80388 RepID=A0A8K0WTT5_9HYPO|nr:putative cytochrome P450 [Stachybotrys elegans]